MGEVESLGSGAEPCLRHGVYDQAKQDNLVTVGSILLYALIPIVTTKLVLNTSIEHGFARILMAIFLNAAIDRFA